MAPLGSASFSSFIVMAVLLLPFLNGLGGRRRFGDRFGRYRVRSRCIGHKGKFRFRFGVLRKLQKACIGGQARFFAHVGGRLGYDDRTLGSLGLLDREQGRLTSAMCGDDRWAEA